MGASLKQLYAFGSITRGEIDTRSDTDVLVITDEFDPEIPTERYSVYSTRRIRELWEEGNPFAWHLNKESVLLYSSDCTSFLESLGPPEVYRNADADCKKFLALFLGAREESEKYNGSIVFEFSNIFLAMRNYATCFSLGYRNHYNFSRRSALEMGEHSVPIDGSAFDVLERSRILSTRGFGDALTDKDKSLALESLDIACDWFDKLESIRKVKQ